MTVLGSGLLYPQFLGFPRVPTTQWENLALSLIEMFFSSWVFSSSSGVSYISCTGGRVLYHWPTTGAHELCTAIHILFLSSNLKMMVKYPQSWYYQCFHVTHAKIRFKAFRLHIRISLCHLDKVKGKKSWGTLPLPLMITPHDLFTSWGSSRPKTAMKVEVLWPAGLT